ncbi:MAG: alpha/beta hydrolase [Anaerolineae bacterium]|nr:alpha/beta hydrolase [Anaerolineae bacterium]
MSDERLSIPFMQVGEHGDVVHFAHANGYPPGTYRQFLAALGRNYRVLAMHYRPIWSAMDPQEMTDWRLVTEDLIAFLDAQGLSGIVGIGHSLGGVTTMYAALQRPDLFRALVFIDPVFLPEAVLAALRANTERNPFEERLVMRALRRRNQWPDRQTAFDHYRPKSVFRALSDAALWDYVNYGLVDNESGVTLAYPREWEARFYALPPTDVWQCVPRLTHPTLALRAANSDTLYPQAWALWQTLQPAATFVELPDVSHLLTMEQPAAVAEPIHRFIESLPNAA